MGFKILSAAETPLPLGVADMVESDLDTRLDNRFLDLRSGDPAWVFRVKAAVIQGMRQSLIDDGFVEITTPKIVATATEGGTELFSVDYFGRDAYLNQSPQLYKQILMASGLDRVFEFGPAFRAETHDTTRHINEFLSVDVEMAFANDSDAMDVAEAAIVGGIRSANTVDPERQIELPGKFGRITYDHAVEVIADGGTEVPWGEDLGSDALRVLAEEYPGYYFIVNWPLESKPFYVQPDGKYGLGFDLMMGHIELASGAQRVHDHDLLVERLEALGLDPEGFEFYLKAFRYGMPPHAGWGLGLERMIQVLVGAENVREAILFPRDMKRLEP
jgi:aspartyl-tRNA synthetase